MNQEGRFSRQSQNSFLYHCALYIIILRSEMDGQTIILKLPVIGRFYRNLFLSVSFSLFYQLMTKSASLNNNVFFENLDGVQFFRIFPLRKHNLSIKINVTLCNIGKNYILMGIIINLLLHGNMIKYQATQPDLDM